MNENPVAMVDMEKSLKHRQIPENGPIVLWLVRDLPRTEFSCLNTVSHLQVSRKFFSKSKITSK